MDSLWHDFGCAALSGNGDRKPHELGIFGIVKSL